MMDFTGGPRQREESAPKAYPVDPVEGFRQAMAAEGLPFDGHSIDPDGRMHRFHIDGDKRGSKNGWYVLFGDPPAGSFGTWKNPGEKKNWSGYDASTLSPEEKAHLQRNMEEAKRQREAEQARVHQEAAREASEIWPTLHPAPEDHPYLIEKKVKSHGLRINNMSALVVPMYGIDGNLVGFTYINSNSTKRLKTGTDPKGAFFVLGTPDSAGPLFICEGFSTGASIHQATGLPVVCAFNAGNLSRVASLWRKKYPAAPITLCADNDDTKERAGQVNAKKAAEAVRGRVVMPEKAGQDFNDLFIAEGPEAVKAALEETSRMDASTVIDNQKILQKAKEILNSQQPCGDFDITRLPKVLSEYVSALRQETAADPIVILQSVLCSISSIMRKNYCIPEGMYFQRLFANIWMLSIALSGSFKTTALNKGAAACFGIKEDLQRQIRAIRGNNEDPSDEDLSRIIKLESQIPILPSRVTAEGLLELLAQDCGGMIMCSELGEWLENISKSFAGALKATLTDFYDVPPFYDYKTRTQRYLKVEQPFITINGVSTLDWIVRNLQPDDVTSGFFARFLILNPPSKRVIPSALPGVKYRSPVVTEFIEMMQGMGSTLRQYHHPVEYSLPWETRQLFEAYHSGLYDALYNESDKAQEILGPYVKRWSPYLLKIAMILQFIEDPDSTVIRPQALEFSKGIVDYAVKSTTHLFQTELGETEHQRKCRKVIEYIARQGGKVSWGTLLRSKTLDGGSSEYEYACNTMAQSGTIIFDISSEQKKNHLLILNTEVEKVGKS